MTAKQILDSFSETLMEDERILTARERDLLSSILRNVKSTSNTNPETHAAVNAVIASAVGETVAQRAFAVLGGSIVERIVAAAGATDVAGDTTAHVIPEPLLAPPQPPQPPGAEKPVKGPAPPQPPQPPGAPKPSPSPVKGPAPPQPPPQPPGHGLRPEHVKMKASDESGSEQVSVLDRPEVLRAQCVVLDEFLAPQELEQLTSYVLQHETDFAASEVISPAGGVIDYEHRRSQVLMDPGLYQDLVLERIKQALPAVFRKLEMEEHPVTRTEFQVTASNDGDFFRMHADNAHEEIASRYLTFVYFFHREPKQFEGGELRIHDSRLESGRHVSAGTYQTIVPQQNQIVFFACELMHEITPVECPSRAFADSRFTLNGWLHR
jgi:SM-20-related protein